MDPHFRNVARSGPGDDLSFGPRYGNTVDVTLTFANIIFTLVPSCLLLVAAVGHVRAYSQRPVVAVRSLLLWAKMVGCSRSYTWQFNADLVTFRQPPSAFSPSPSRPQSLGAPTRPTALPRRSRPLFCSACLPQPCCHLHGQSTSSRRIPLRPSAST